MNVKEMGGSLGAKARAALDRYKFVLLVILAGILLLTLPDLLGGASGSAEAGTQSAGGAFSLTETEEKLERALSRIEGAGDVTVILTVKTGARQVLAEDAEFSQSDDGLERSSETVVISRGSGYQETVAVQEVSPQYQGALVVCAGGGDPAVKLKLVEAVSALTGLGSDKISVCKGK